LECGIFIVARQAAPNGYPPPSPLLPLQNTNIICLLYPLQASRLFPLAVGFTGLGLD
jgi:hypothetical protein